MKKFICLALSIALLSGCKKNSSADYGLDPKETIRTNLSTEPPSLDWHVSSDTTSSEVTMNIMDGLVDYDLSDANLKLIPALATKWEVSKDQKTWTFTLRNDVKWTDGQPFTGQQLIDGWERLLNPNTPATYSYMLFNVKNAKKYNQKEISDFSQVGVKLNTKGQIVVELIGPQSYFPMLMAHHSLYPIRKDVVEKFGDRWTRPENIQTLGAYKLNVWDNDKAIVLERNPNYFAGAAKTKFVLMRIIKEASTALKMFEKGQLDVDSELPSLELARLKQLPEYHVMPSLGIYYIGMNVKKAPLDNVLVRKALNMAVDRAEICKLLNGGQVPISGWLPLGIFGYNAEIGLKFNPEEAKKLLDQAGYSDRAKLPKIVIAFNTNENHQRVVENIQAQFKRNLGISVEVQNSEWKTYNQQLIANAPQLFRFGWIADFPDPDTFFDVITSGSENNHSGWSNAQFDSLVKKAVGVSDLGERKKLYDQAHRILMEDEVPAIPIYSYTKMNMVAKRVENFPLNALQRFVYKNVVLKQ